MIEDNLKKLANLRLKLNHHLLRKVRLASQNLECPSHQLVVHHHRDREAQRKQEGDQHLFRHNRQEEVQHNL